MCRQIGAHTANDVSVSQDRDKGVVTLSGKVRSDDDKGRAESIAKSVWHTLEARSGNSVGTLKHSSIDQNENSL